MLKDRKIVLGVSGGIAAYKACELVSRLKKRGAQVRVVMTGNACEFVSPLTFETLSGSPAYTDGFDRKYEINHVALGKWMDAMVVAPATANVLAKMASGIADDLLTTTLLAANAPVLAAPAMNTAMWSHPATRANVATLRDRGVHFVGPESGRLACGDADMGRMSEPARIEEALEVLFRCDKKDLAGRRVLVTAGPTVERIDPVRYITNRSTGKMGYAIAEAAADRGAEVLLVSGPVQLSCPKGVRRIMVESSAELCREVLSAAETADVVIQAAAPADFTPETVSQNKIKKTGQSMALVLKATTDIARELGARKRAEQVLVAFAAETGNLLENASGKRVSKNADFVVANDVTLPGAGFGAETNIVTIVDEENVEQLPIMSKRQVADRILDRVCKRLEAL
ncbi:MAG: bifunctional phosphopantothenoylcysteine decarboxylase/phosphopantothenate--cysteine ligase CoaBC [Christensenellales bacterium]|nr:bifunctional phosphopantothenoylcysteine decarboxylase/phosphopantothenate--cysteine ligase CoaBC [Christensenellales bacterium]